MTFTNILGDEQLTPTPHVGKYSLLAPSLHLPGSDVTPYTLQSKWCPLICKTGLRGGHLNEFLEFNKIFTIYLRNRSKHYLKYFLRQIL